MGDWRLEYKRNYLETLINKKRVLARRPLINPDKVDRIIKYRMDEENLPQLEATNKLINEVREGKEL